MGLKMQCEYKNGTLEIWVVHGDESGWAISYGADCLFCLYELPIYGGEPRLIGTYSNFHVALQEAGKLT